MDSHKLATTGTEAVDAVTTPPDDPNSPGDHGNLPNEVAVSIPGLQEDQILGVLCDLFAGRTQVAFGENLEWWSETFQCDLAPETASGVALVALSKWPFDQRAGAPGVKALQDELLKRARMLIERSPNAIKEAV